MSTHLFLAGMGNVVSGLGVACLNAIVALALVAVSLLLVFSVSSVAWLYDSHKEIRPIRGRPERRALA
ncbi:MAG: hypothetical protein QOJ15_8626 [Bradyrhizobium sp.]|jgi:hypothetical protein|nr:hypothetical protein [Bradyrhizobium sp.]